MSGPGRYAPLVVCFALLACVYPLQRWIDASSDTSAVEEEALYLSNGESIRRLSLGYEAALADVYWMRMIQYFGRKVYADRAVLNGRSDRLKLLYPLADVTTTLDPQYIAAYRFGGYFTHDYVDPVESYALLEKGIKNNPTDWRLYQDLAFLLWSDGRCAEAAQVYEQGAHIPYPPPWMTTMAATVLTDCGDLTTAAQMYEHVLGSTTDERVRAEIDAKLKGLEALHQIDALQQAISAYAAANKRPPAVPAQAAPFLPHGTGVAEVVFDAATGQAVDPTGVPYAYDPATGAVTARPEGVRLPTKIMQTRTP